MKGAANDLVFKEKKKDCLPPPALMTIRSSFFLGQIFETLYKYMSRIDMSTIRIRYKYMIKLKQND